MKTALILYWHGLGDVIQLTPVLRDIYNQGYLIDLMCRKEVTSSHLLDGCPYIDKLIDVENPFRSPYPFAVQRLANIQLLNNLKSIFFNSKNKFNGVCSLPSPNFS